MIAAKLKGTVSQDHRLELEVPPSIPPGKVEVIILYLAPPEKRKKRAPKLTPHVHPAAGIWADRTGIGDTIAFVSQLRHRLKTRGNARR